MAISDTLDAAKRYLEELSRNRRFRRANLAREDAIELQTSLAKCRGKLELCQKDFNRTIKSQSKYISEGMAIGADTMIQEQMLWDAAIGYLLVRDAIYALKTINTHDSVSHAYEMLDAATRQMAGKKPRNAAFNSSKTRNIYGYITSSAAAEEKSALLDTFFEKLKVTGDMELCLSTASNPANRQADLRNAYTKGTISQELQHTGAEPTNDAEEAMKRLNNVDSREFPDEDFDLSAVQGIRPPKEEP